VGGEKVGGGGRGGGGGRWGGGGGGAGGGKGVFHTEEEEDGCLFKNAYVPACLKGEGGGRGGDERGK